MNLVTSTKRIRPFAIKFFDEDDVILTSKFFFVFDGGISKILQKQLEAAGENIATKKLLNYENNFFLTSRTAKRVIEIPENEIEPLFFYLMDTKKFYFINENSVIESIGIITSQSLISQANFDIQSKRRQWEYGNNRLMSYFEIKDHNDLHYGQTPSDWDTIPTICTIVITEGKATDFFIKFQNSWGIYEKIALYEIVKYNPEFENAEDLQIYDNELADFTILQIKKTVKNIFSATVDCCNSDRRNFVLDMLLAEKCYMVAYGKEYSAKVTMENGENFDKVKSPANTLTLNITLNTDETYMSNLDFESNKSEDENEIFNNNYSNIFA
jgi:hypothetical protein